MLLALTALVSLLGFVPDPTLDWWLGDATEKPDRFIAWFGGHSSIVVRAGLSRLVALVSWPYLYPLKSGGILHDLLPVASLA